MTASFQTSFFTSSTASKNRSRRSSFRLWQVDVENFDHEVETYEIEAPSASKAAEIVEGMVSEIYNMNIAEIPE